MMPYDPYEDPRFSEVRVNHPVVFNLSWEPGKYNAGLRLVLEVREEEWTHYTPWSSPSQDLLTIEREDSSERVAINLPALPADIFRLNVAVELVLNEDMRGRFDWELHGASVTLTPLRSPSDGPTIWDGEIFDDRFVEENRYYLVAFERSGDSWIIIDIGE